jgi:hypothetical protein
MWSDCVDDLWEKHLPHLREEIIAGEGLFVFNLATGYYGFQEGDYEDDAAGDELAASLDREEVDEEKPDKNIELLEDSAAPNKEHEESGESTVAAVASEGIPVPGNYNKSCR